MDDGLFSLENERGEEVLCFLTHRPYVLETPDNPPTYVQAHAGNLPTVHLVIDHSVGKLFVGMNTKRQSPQFPHRL